MRQVVDAGVPIADHRGGEIGRPVTCLGYAGGFSGVRCTRYAMRQEARRGGVHVDLEPDRDMIRDAGPRFFMGDPENLVGELQPPRAGDRQVGSSRDPDIVIEIGEVGCTGFAKGRFGLSWPQPGAFRGACGPESRDETDGFLQREARRFASALGRWRNCAWHPAMSKCHTNTCAEGAVK